MARFDDLFCGAGGSSIGLTAAGHELVLAANHWQRAIDTHSANFPDAEHWCEDINKVDMRRLPPADILWASPICTEVSPAGGRKRRKRQTAGQLDLLEYGPVAKEGFERTRATFHDVIRATEVHRFPIVLVENVVEVAEWELFDWWLSGMQILGYNVQFVSVSSAHVGGGEIPYAPQWRDRLYMVFSRKDVPLPDVELTPDAWCPNCDTVVQARQAWKKTTARRIGKYGERQQYVYRCPNSSCRHAVVEPFVLPAAAAIDWSDLGIRIGDKPLKEFRNRKTGEVTIGHLAPATIRRIEAGIRMFGEPVAVAVHGNTYERPGYVRARPTGGAGDGLAVPPMLVPSGGTWNVDPTTVYEPMRTRLANEKGFESLVVPPFLTMLRGNGRAMGADEPLATVMTGRHHYLTVPPGAFLQKHHGGLDYEPIEHMLKDVSEPMPSLVVRPNLSLVVPYRRGNAKTTAEPLHTLSTRDSAALVQAELEVLDCLFRMLKPREHLRGQAFPDSYVVHGNQGEQTMQAGNAVSTNVAQLFGERVAIALGEAAA